MRGRAGGMRAWGVGGGLLLAVAAIGTAQTDCATGTAVADPHHNPGLVADCAALLAASGRWTDDGGLNWSPHLEFDEWDGVTVDAAGMRVTRVSLAWQGLEGAVPPELGRLTELERLDLAHNRLSGSIPAALAALVDLERLDLSHNELSGTIPGELGSLADLETLDLAGNTLSGSIPGALANLADLEVLDLRYNELSGTIPSELGALSDLQTLSLAGNRLSGSIPGTLGDLAELERLDLAYNRLSGALPIELGNLSDLETLHLGGNVLGGPIPDQWGTLAGLEMLDLSGNQLHGGIPLALADGLHRLELLNLAGNNFDGTVPAALRSRADLTLDLSGNRLLAAAAGRAVAGVPTVESERRDARMLEWVASSHRIRIDQLDSTPRYASWQAATAPDDEPDLVLSDGRTIQEVGGRAALYYLFTSGAYRYVILDYAVGGQEARTGCLFVYQGRTRIRAEPIRPAQPDAAADTEPAACDVDIGAKIDRWLEVSE